MEKIERYRESKILSIAVSIATAAAILTVSIAVPLLCRPFYHAHMQSLQLTEASGLTEGQIRETYDEVMDYCLGLSEEFSLTHLRWSEDGASHFADVRRLFLLDLWIAGISCAILLAIWAFGRWRKYRTYRFRGHMPGFWAAIGLGTAFLIIGLLAAIDFDRAFVVFHSIFFPGKDNWIFDYNADPVIRMLPEEFFRNCLILIVGTIMVWCAALLVRDGLARRRTATQE